MAVCAGEYFVAVLGAQQSALEAVLLKRRVMGPSWLTLACPTRVDTGAQVTAFHRSHDLHRIFCHAQRWDILWPMSLSDHWQETAALGATSASAIISSM